MQTEQETALLSVVVPVYNTEQYLARCIKSIRNQTYRNLEIILVDDGSLDESGKICDAYAETDTRIRVVHKQNGGHADARCAGIEMARGDYLGFVDSDDWIEPEMYEKLLKDSPDYDLITSGILRHDEAENASERLMDTFPLGTYQSRQEMEYFFDNLLICKCRMDGIIAEGLLHSVCSKLFKMSIVKEMYKAANVSIQNGEDWLFCMLYVLRCNSVKVMHESYYHYMYRANSTSNSKNLNFLRESNELYLAISSALKGHWMEKSLRQQFQKCFMYRVMTNMPKLLGFDDSAVLPRFICSFSDKLEGKKIVLFGAGKVGRDYYRELTAMGHHVALWVDNYSYGASYCGKEIDPPDRLEKMEYDSILCAFASMETANEVRNQLINKGIPDEKILWEQPYDFMNGFLMG